jgi:hypothetical protein
MEIVDPRPVDACQDLRKKIDLLLVVALKTDPVARVCTLGTLIFIRQTRDVHREPFDFVGFLSTLRHLLVL